MTVSVSLINCNLNSLIKYDQEQGLVKVRSLVSLVNDQSWWEYKNLLDDYQSVTQCVDRFQLSVAFFMFVMVFITIPIQCFSLYLSSYLKSSPEIRSISFLCLGIVSFGWVFTFISAATLNHK